QESLSILNLSEDKHFHVKNYYIRRTNEVEMDGLCCLLSYPCRKVKLTATADQHGLLELDRSQLVQTELLNTGNFDDVFKGKYG
ncbi:unnamed protein product, partial [Rotaria sp. Silwood1]